MNASPHPLTPSRSADCSSYCVSGKTEYQTMTSLEGMKNRKITFRWNFLPGRHHVGRVIFTHNVIAVADHPAYD